MRGVAILTTLFALFGGCVDTPAGSVAPLSGPISSAHDAVVVAVIDSGINPYHEAFRATSPGRPVVPARDITLSSSGSFGERLRADGPAWGSIQTKELVHFAGTRILAISFHSDGERVVLDEVGHGTNVASIVARDAPQATILSIEVSGSLCDPSRQPLCIVDPSIADAMNWAAEQPWIDIISVSLGPPPIPPSDPVNGEYGRYVDATRLASAYGKLIVASAGNNPHPTIQAAYKGPPWIICVGGAEGVQRGESATASKLVDVIANYTTTVAVHDDLTRIQETGGTSFAAPVVAATIANAMSIVRSQTTEVPTPEKYRDALNVSAVRWQPSDWAPTEPVSNNTIRNLGSPTLPIVAGPAQRGWGYVDASLAPMVAGVVQGRSTSEVDPLTVAWMARYQAEREAIWRE